MSASFISDRMCFGTMSSWHASINLMEADEKCVAVDDVDDVVEDDDDVVVVVVVVDDDDDRAEVDDDKFSVMLSNNSTL